MLLWQPPRRAASVVAWATVLYHTYGEALRLDAVGLYLFTASSLQQKHSKTSPFGQVVPIIVKLLAVQSCRHSSTLLTSVYDSWPCSTAWHGMALSPGRQAGRAQQAGMGR